MDNEFDQRWPLLLREPTVSTGPLFTATIKSRCEDFKVRECLDLDFSGQGEHLYVKVEKTAMNSHVLPEMLAKSFQCSPSDIGFAGLKDRCSVSEQWFSVRTPLDDGTVLKRFKSMADSLEPPERLRLLTVQRHHRKLRRGAHSGNGFTILLRDVRPVWTSERSPERSQDRLSERLSERSRTQAAVLPESRMMADQFLHDSLHELSSDSSEWLVQSVAERLTEIGQSGIPNYYGPQRFGYQRNNLRYAERWISGPRRRIGRHKRGVWLSAVRSALFNTVCAHRVLERSWQCLLPGEPAVLDGSRSFFIPQEQERQTAALQSRLDTLDIHPSGPCWGRGDPLVHSECARLEATILQPYASLCTGLEQAGLQQQRRALRAQVTDLSSRWLDRTQLQLSFFLPPGVFATSVLRELGDCHQPSGFKTPDAAENPLS